MDTFRRATRATRASSATRAFLILITIFVACAVSAICSTPACAQSFAQSYVVIDATTGHVLDGANMDKKLQVASLTKIATAMVVLDWKEATKADLNQLATVPQSAAALGGDQVLGLQPGDQMSMRDLLYAALLMSDNTAALTLANHVGQSLPRAADVPAEYAFVAQMNALARKLRMEHTLFLNPHGLDGMKGKLPYSSSGDMARLAAYAMDRAEFRFYVSQKEREVTVIHMDNTQARFGLRNTNELLGSDSHPVPQDGAPIDGVKTGTTEHAGQCLIISAARKPDSVKNGDNNYTITPRRLIVVVLGAGDRFKAANGLIIRGWQLYDTWAAKGRALKREEALVL